jgi:hypothetical protein
MKIWDAAEHERFEKLETKMGELWILIDMLLGRSGLDQDGILRAHEYAAKSWREIVDAMAKRASDEFLSTPEGREARRLNDEAWKQRMGDFWREDCRIEGRILPDPRTRSSDQKDGQ